MAVERMNADHDRRPDRERSGPRCPRCGGTLHRRHCKYVCPRHGVVVDCSDPFVF